MMKLLDYYYLVLLRGYENMLGKDRFFSFHVAGIISMTLIVNFTALVILLSPCILVYFAFWVSFIITGIIIMNILDAIYNKKRREKLRKEYEDENFESRRRGAAWVWAYEILSIIFLIFSISISEMPIK